MDIAIIGSQCAGKTTVANAIAKRVGARSVVVKFADPHYAILDILGQKKNRLFMQEVSDVCKKHFGDDIFVKLFEKAYDPLWAHFQIVFCDDVRYQKELDMVKKLGFKTIFVNCSSGQRMARALANNLAFNESHNSETEVESLRPQCDFIIENDLGDDIDAQIATIFAPM